MKYVSIETKKLNALIELVAKVKQMTEEKASQQTAEPHKIYRLQEALEILDISREEFRRERYAGRIQYHQADDKFWFYFSELIDFRNRYLSPSAEGIA